MVQVPLNTLYTASNTAYIQPVIVLGSTFLKSQTAGRPKILTPFVLFEFDVEALSLPSNWFVHGLFSTDWSKKWH